jgi:hypothetical protein
MLHGNHANRGGSAVRSSGIIFLLVYATAYIYCQPELTVVKVNDLSFGADFGGRVKRLDHADIGAAKFQIQSAKETKVLLTVMLPDFFISTGGSEKIPVSFDERSAAWSVIDNVSSRTSFDPRQPLRLTLGPDQIIYVWVGGALHPSRSQRVSRYYGSITLTVQKLPGD